MKKIALLLLLLLSRFSAGQNTVVSATMVDTDGTAWFSATWRIDFQPNPSQPNESAYRLLNGQPLNPTVTHQNGTTNASGFFTVNLYDSTLIAPAGSSWMLTMCPKASVQCSTYQFSSAGFSMDLSSRLTTNFPPPRFQANGAGAYGYIDTEAMVQVSIGGCYWNVTNNNQRCWNGTAFINSAGGGLTPAGNPNEVQINSGGPNLGAATGVTYNGSNGLNMASSITSNQPMADIRSPSFAGGAKCDGVTDDTPTVQAAINALPNRGGNILIPSGPTTTTYCYIAHPETLIYNNSSNGSINFYMTGITQFGTTWGIPSGPFVNIIGYGGNALTQFQGVGTTAGMIIKLPTGSTGNGTGTLGSLNGGSGTALSSFAVTTGTINSGSNQLTLTDPTSYNVGDWVTLANAGASGFALMAHITALAGNVATLDVSAANTMTASQSTGNLVGRNITFTPSSTGGLVAGSSYWNVGGMTGGSGADITVEDQLSCSLTGMTRTSNLVTATVSLPCHIPVGAMISITGASDTSFNGVPTASCGGSLVSWTCFRVITNDYYTGRITWRQTAANQATAQTGTIGGMNEDTLENVSLLQNTSTTATATFWRPHTSATNWGLDTLAALGGHPSFIKDFNAGGYIGTGIVYSGFHGRLENVGAGSQACNAGVTNSTNFGFVYMTSFVKMSGISVTASCQPWGLRMTQPTNAPNGISGPIYINDSFIMGGIKADHGATTTISLTNVILDQVTAGGIIVDPTNYWSAGFSTITIDGSGYNDNPAVFPTCFVYYEQFPSVAQAFGATTIHNPGSFGCTTNEYYIGQLRNEAYGAYTINTAQNTPRGPMGTYNDGRMFIGEQRSLQSALSPSLIPHATQNLPTINPPTNGNPNSGPYWTMNSCSAAIGIDSPDGGSSATRLTSTTPSGMQWYYQTTPAVGDIVIYGGWVRTTTPGLRAGSGGSGTAFTIDNFASPNYTWGLVGSTTGGGSATSLQFDSTVYDDWWHPVVSIAQVITSNNTANQYVRISLNCDNQRSMDFWDPFLIYIKASEGFPLRELMRWRSDLLHGFVPPNAVAGKLYANNPIVAPVQDSGGQVFNVKTFGAVGDGVTDDDLAIQNATNAAIGAGGGTVFFPRGKYYVSSTHANTAGYIWAQASHMHFKCDPGASLATPVPPAGGSTTLFYLGYPAAGGIQQKAGFLANTLPYSGSPSITLTTPTDTSNFAVGDPIYIIGAPGTEANGDGEINWITAINTSTGILTLQKPTSKIYTGSNSPGIGVSGSVTVVDGAGMFYSDISIEDCTALNISNDFAYFGQIIGGKMLRNTVTVSPASGRGMMINSYYPMANIEVAGNKYVGGSTSVWQLADGFRDVFLHDNDLTSPNGAVVLNPSQGIINLHISNNNLYLNTTNASLVNNNTGAIVFSTAYNNTVDHNHIFVGNPLAQGYSAVLLSLSNGACHDCIFDSNVIVGNNLSQALSTGSAPNIKVTNNIISCVNCHKVVLELGQGDVFSGNSIHSFGTNTLYIAEVDSTQAIFSENSITSDVLSTNMPAVRVGIPAGSNGIISNNYITNTSRGIQVDSGSPTFTGNVCEGVSSYTAYCGINLAGTATMGTAAIAAGTCAPVVTVAATGVVTTDTISWSYNSGTYTFLTVGPYATAGNVNFLICNSTANSVTPPAVTLNWRVVR